MYACVCSHVDQLAAKLVAANSVSPNFKPIAVMTDLVRMGRMACTPRAAASITLLATTAVLVAAYAGAEPSAAAWEQG